MRMASVRKRTETKGEERWDAYVRFFEKWHFKRKKQLGGEYAST